MIYLDNAATTQPYNEVIETITDVLNNNWGNASSNYDFGHQSKEIIENVRDQIAEDINCDPEEIIFTSSGCEANSLAIGGMKHFGYEFFTTKMEHSSIIEAVPYLNKVHFVHNDRLGNVAPNMLYRTLKWNQIMRKNKPFVSIGGANSEIGTIQDVKALSNVVHHFDGIFHCDMTALYPHRRIDVKELGIDMMTVSAQKFHATEGVGFLYVKKGINLWPIIYGAQENKLRGGSYNTALIAGMGRALDITRNRNNSYEHLRNKLLDGLLKIPGVKFNGPLVNKNRLENNISLTIDGVDAETLLTLCDITYGICISKGSACHSYEKKPSNTLKAIGLSDKEAFETIRITVGEMNTEQEIDDVLLIMPNLIEQVRKTS